MSVSTSWGNNVKHANLQQASHIATTHQWYTRTAHHLLNSSFCISMQGHLANSADPSQAASQGETIGPESVLFEFTGPYILMKRYFAYSENPGPTQTMENRPWASLSVNSIFNVTFFSHFMHSSCHSHFLCTLRVNGN